MDGENIIWGIVLIAMMIGICFVINYYVWKVDMQNKCVSLCEEKDLVYDYFQEAGEYCHCKKLNNTFRISGDND